MLLNHVHEIFDRDGVTEADARQGATDSGGGDGAMHLLAQACCVGKLLLLSYLITVPNLLDSLAGLYETVDSRLSCFKRLRPLGSTPRAG